MKASTIVLSTLAMITGASQLGDTGSDTHRTKLSEHASTELAPISLHTNLDQIPVVVPFGPDHYIVGGTIFHLQSVNMADYAKVDPEVENTEELDPDVREWLMSDPNIVWTAELMRKLLEKGLLGPPLWVYRSSEGRCYIRETCCCGNVLGQ